MASLQKKSGVHLYLVLEEHQGPQGHGLAHRPTLHVGFFYYYCNRNEKRLIRTKSTLERLIQTKSTPIKPNRPPKRGACTESRVQRFLAHEKTPPPRSF